MNLRFDVADLFLWVYLNHPFSSCYQFYTGLQTAGNNWTNTTHVYLLRHFHSNVFILRSFAAEQVRMCLLLVCIKFVWCLRNSKVVEGEREREQLYNISLNLLYIWPHPPTICIIKHCTFSMMNNCPHCAQSTSEIHNVRVDFGYPTSANFCFHVLKKKERTRWKSEMLLTLESERERERYVKFELWFLYAM